MEARFCLAVWCALQGAAGLFGQTRTARIQGLVVGEDGVPLTGAMVSYNRQVDLARSPSGRYRLAPGERERYTTGQITTAAGGSFAIANLTAGRYGLCIHSAGFLNPCAWSAPIPITLTDGANVNIGRVTLTRGATVQIRINDPLRLLPDFTRTSSPITVGVWRGVAFTAAIETAKNAGGRTLSVIVPYDTDLTFWVHSPLARLTDQLGASLDARGTQIPFSVPRGTVPAGCTLNVQGLR